MFSQILRFPPMDKVASSLIPKNFCQGVSLRTWKLRLQPLLVNTSLLSGLFSELKIMASSEYSLMPVLLIKIV